MKAVILIVLYKQNLSTSKTILSILNCNMMFKDSTIIVWDNSPKAILTEEFSVFDHLQLNYKYFHSPQNISLAKIYNKVVDNHRDTDLFFVFDQDTIVTEDYFVKILNAVASNPDIYLFVPYICVNNQIVSPGDFGFFDGKYWKEVKLGVQEAKNRVAVASGMAIDFKCFNNQGITFDENLSLYGIDSKFCIDYSSKNKYFFVIDYNIIHNLSIFEQESKETKLMRLKSHSLALRNILKQRNKVAYFFAFFIYLLKVIQIKIKNN